MKELGIIVAQQEEAQPLLDRLSAIKCADLLEKTGYDMIHVYISGVGKLNAMDATVRLLNSHRVDAILNIGVSAGRGDLEVGDLVAVSKVYDGDFDISVFNHPKYYVPEVGDYIEVEGRETHLKSLPCFSISKFLEGDIDTDIEDYVVDMEYYGIAFACKERKISTYSIKAISDTNKSDSSSEYESNLENCSQLLADYVMDYILVP